MYDWNDLKFLLAIARTGSTLGAAKALGVNQSTVARRSEALEDALGIQLFERRPGGYRLTARGQELAAMAEAVEAGATHIADTAASWRRQISGTVRVTTTELVATAILAPLISRLSATHPGLTVELIAGDRRLDLQRSEVDVAIRVGSNPSEPSLVQKHLGESVWAIFAARSYADQYGLPGTAGDLAAHTILAGGGDLVTLQPLEWLAEAAAGARIAMRCNSVPNLIAAVRSGVGIGPLPYTGVDETVVRCLDVEWRSDVWLLYHETQRSTPHIRAFLDAFTAYFATVRGKVDGTAFAVH
ncbi:LysR family transcriptional regulator [Youhaiella tibetensis]|uniref:LysR family transcriptional regulator n=1 Tax=Paradevosia tibetensis TaxID=1447062 RepID=A0A5B9DPP7_9HYPH|nr:LysR family transcriptional regulator [Youhaiella tibetensis]QEE21197.1 LysR family transcriptional regulator [Youhaiella tibetensis]GGF17078.1 LysR family transcriptional regulator [Youhaiella tibetensis]